MTDTAGDSTQVALLLILLVGSITAGVLFASPLRRRYTGERSATQPPPMPGRETLTNAGAPAPARPYGRRALPASIWSTSAAFPDERYLPR